jgi:hypothetical protein
MSKENSLLKKVTIDSALDELLGSAAAGVGVVGASIGMKALKNANVNPWLISIAAAVAGYGIRLAVKDETLKDIGTGILIAGTLDGAKKILNKVTATNKTGIFNTINTSIPELSGLGQTSFRVLPGYVEDRLRGAYQTAQVVDMRL